MSPKTKKKIVKRTAAKKPVSKKRPPAEAGKARKKPIQRPASASVTAEPEPESSVTTSTAAGKKKKTASAAAKSRTRKPSRAKRARSKSLKPEVLEPVAAKKGKPKAKASASGDKALVKFDPLQRYLAEISNYRLLTREEERELGIRVREYGDKEAAYSLVTSNLRLVVKIALEFQRVWMQNLLDLIQERSLRPAADWTSPANRPPPCRRTL